MRRPARSARAATRARRARPLLMQENPRLSPHTPSSTHTRKQQNHFPSLRGALATKQSRAKRLPARHWIASLTLAMTAQEKSIRVLVLGHQRHRRLRKNVEIEQHGPVLDVIEIELDALLDLFLVVDLAAPAIDLRPAGDPRLDTVAGEIAVDGLVEQAGLQFAEHRMRTRPDQGEIALEDDVEELRQLVEAGLADEAADPGDARIVPGHHLRRGRIGLVVVERAELEDVDPLIVEAEALLAE